MTDAIRKVPDPNGRYYYVRKIRVRDYPEFEWKHDPDVSALQDVDPKYWKWDDVNERAVEMSQAEKEALDTKLNNQSVPLDGQVLWTFQNSGRFYLNTNMTWVTDGDDWYGGSYFHFAESAGKADQPIDEWEHQGTLVEEGDIIRRLTLSGRVSSPDVTDVEYTLLCRTPTNAADWSNGINFDAEMRGDEVYRDTFFIPSKEHSGEAFTGARTHMHRRTIDINFTVPKDGFLTLYVRPVGNAPAGRRYFISTYQIQVLTQD